MQAPVLQKHRLRRHSDAGSPSLAQEEKWGEVLAKRMPAACVENNFFAQKRTHILLGVGTKKITR